MYVEAEHGREMIRNNLTCVTSSWKRGWKRGSRVAVDQISYGKGTGFSWNWKQFPFLQTDWLGKERETSDRKGLMFQALEANCSVSR